MICEEARAAVLSGEDVSQYADHLARCHDCRAAIPEAERFRRALADPAIWEEPAQSVDDLMAALPASSRVTPSAVHRRPWRIGVAASVLAVLGVAVVVAVRGDSADWVAPLVGAESAPGATGRVEAWNVAGGTRLLLETAGIDPAPAGEVYEFWFMSGDEAFSAGTFVDPRRVHLMVGVSRGEYPNLLVTREPADGDPSPSATWVLWSTWDEEEP